MRCRMFLWKPAAWNENSIWKLLVMQCNWNKRTAFRPLSGFDILSKSWLPEDMASLFIKWLLPEVPVHWVLDCRYWHQDHPANSSHVQFSWVGLARKVWSLLSWPPLVHSFIQFRAKVLTGKGEQEYIRLFRVEILFLICAWCRRDIEQGLLIFQSFVITVEVLCTMPDNTTNNSTKSATKLRKQQVSAPT